MASTPSTNKSRAHLTLREKQTVLSVFDNLQKDYKTLTVDKLVTKCSNFTQFGKSTIYRILHERKLESLKSPLSKSGRKPIKFDEDEKNALRRLVHSFYFRKEIPTVDKVYASIKQDGGFPNIGRTKLWKTLREINFSWEKHNRKAVLIESDEIVCWRRKYLRQIRQFRSEGKNIYFLDETWVNEGHTVGKHWQDKNVKSARQAFMEGWSTGMKPPSGKGKRLIIVHIGNEKGFVKGGLLVFPSNHTGDYHEDMNGDTFEEYFQQMLDLIPPGSVIVMDNASYHSRNLEKVPTTAWRKADICKWLTEKNINFEADMVKKELLSLVNSHKEKFNKKVVDDMAEKRNITVLRLPPYHCELNPIELIWAQMKGYVARNNTTYKLKDVEVLFQESVKKITPDNWHKCVQHVLKVEEKMWKLDCLIEATVEPLIISLDENESDDESIYCSSESE